jgi:SAM-dependent methyltransferase
MQETDFRWYTERMFKDQINAWSDLFDFFQSELDQQGKVVVEIGCGPTGGVLKFIKARLRIGIEPLANRFLEKGFENILNPDILLLDSFGEQVPLVNGFADVVCCMHSLGHVRQPERVLAETDRILKEEGMVLILEIMRTPEQLTRDHAVSLLPDDLIGWFEAHNYSPIRIDTTRTIKEDSRELPLFYGIFKKEKGTCDLSAMIDFEADPCEPQVAGGWYELEMEERASRWVSDQFSAYLGLSKEHNTLITEGYVVLDHFANQELSVSFFINEIKVGDHTFKQNGPFRLEMPFRHPFPEGRVRIRGRSNQFFVPHEVLGNGDHRELSLMIFRVGLRTQGSGLHFSESPITECLE